MKTFTTAIALGALSIAAVPASAETVSIAVETQDINLSSAKGQKVLETRIRDAARKACGFNDRTPGIRGRTEATKRCYAKALNNAHGQYAKAREATTYGG